MKVWLIIDEQEVIDFFEESIKSIDYIELSIFNSLEEFLKKMEEDKNPDMIFLDGSLDGINLSSVDIVKKIRQEEGNGVLIYALTNSPRIEDEMEHAGANGYFRKDDFELIEKFLKK